MDAREKNIFLGLYRMLLVDDEIHPAELGILYQIGKEKGGISEEEIQKAILTTGINLSIDDLSDDDRIEYLYNLSRIAVADGFIDVKEREMLQDTSKLLGFSEENVSEITKFLLDQARESKTFEEVLEIIKNS